MIYNLEIEYSHNEFHYFFKIMSKNLPKNHQTKTPKLSRKSSTNSRRSSKPSEITAQLPPHTNAHFDISSNELDHDLLTEIIEDLTSDIDDTRAPSTSSILSIPSRENKNEKLSPPTNTKRISLTPLRNPECLAEKRPPRSSKKSGKSNQNETKFTSSSCADSFGEKYDLSVPRKSLGEQRRDELTKHMKEFYQYCYEFDKNSNINYNNDYITNSDIRKQYSAALW